MDEERRIPKEYGEKEQGSDYFVGNEWNFPSDLALLNPAADEVEKRLKEALWGEDEIAEIRMGFWESLANAIRHGNKESSEKQVHVNVAIGPEEVKLVIADEGQGFNWREVKDPREKEALDNQSGRGILMMRDYFDRVEYNQKGNEVLLIKSRAGRKD